MEKATAKMMPGTQSGATYFAFAKKGNVVLGIKPYGILRGEMFGVSGTTYFTARLRSAPAGNLFADDAPKTVVKLEKAPENLWDAWPGVTWEKKSAMRASTSVGVFLRGEFSRDHVQLQKLLDQFKDGKMTTQMADYLIGVAGVDHLIVTKRELQTWLEAQYKPLVEQIVDKIEKSKQVAVAMEEQVGVFGMQAAILKKVYGETADTEDSDTAKDAEPEVDEPHDGQDQDD
jgi:hypothetical protein